MKLLAQIHSTVFIFAAFAGMMFAVGYSFYLIGKRNAQAFAEYEAQYKVILDMITNYPVNRGNYDLIVAEFHKLNALKYKDRENTSVLFTQFAFRFKEEGDKRLTENY